MLWKLMGWRPGLLVGAMSEPLWSFAGLHPLQQILESRRLLLSTKLPGVEVDRLDCEAPVRLKVRC